jgi:TrmH family RNA methyltransferase
MPITSRDNSLLRQARAVREGKVDDLIFVEGLRLCEEALYSDLSIEAVIFSEEIAIKPKAASVINNLAKQCARMAAVSEKLLESISFTKTPQGIIVLAQRPDTSEARLSQDIHDIPLVVILHQLNNPVNVGAVLRTAEAAGATGVITTQNTTDPFSPRALRGAMGSAFRLPIWNGPSYSEAIEWCNKQGIISVCAAATARPAYTEIDWTGARALILGTESTGLAEAEINAAGEAVRIPIQRSVESLNVSVAAGILLYEAVRQRQSARE